MEAEYVTATHAAKEAIWLCCLLTELFDSIDSPTTLFSDSKSTIALAHDGHYHAWTKHIDIRYHFIRYIIEAGTIKLVYCPTNDMTADILTKVLPSMKAKHFASALGLCTVWGGVLKKANHMVYPFYLSHFISCLFCEYRFHSWPYKFSFICCTTGIHYL